MWGQSGGQLWTVRTDQSRIGTDSFDKQTCRQKVSASIQDVSSARFANNGAHRVAAGRVTQLRMANYLQIHQAIAQQTEGQKHDDAKAVKPPLGRALQALPVVFHVCLRLEEG